MRENRLTSTVRSPPDELLRYGERSALPITPAMLMTIGDRIDPPPEPFPDEFLACLAATVAADPVTFGRLCLHGLKALEGADHE